MIAPSKPRVLIALSGGVDSSVAAALLQEQGYDCVGVTLHLWDAQGESKVGRCCSPTDREDARHTADLLGIPYYVIDEREAFQQTVVDPFVAAYKAGTTPAPCVACNQHVKLGRLIQLADRFDCAYVATGHYAQLRQENGQVSLFRGADLAKDQSYFLYGVPMNVLSRLLFPLGHMTKEETRAQGQRLNVPNWNKKDSQELCFVPDGKTGDFVSRQAGEKRAGRIVLTTGEMLAPHDGVEHFTVGQRKGLGIGGGDTRYVLKILPNTGDVVVGNNEDLFEKRCQASQAIWIHPTPDEFEASVQVRYKHQAAAAKVRRTAEGFEAEFLEPQRAIAPGQALVVYQGAKVLGGGIITA